MKFDTKFDKNNYHLRRVQNPKQSRLGMIFKSSKILKNSREISLLDLEAFSFHFHFSISISSRFYFTFISRSQVIYFLLHFSKRVNGIFSSGLEVGFYPVLSEMPSRHMLNCRSQSRGRPGPCRLANPESCEESIVIEGISWHYGLRFRMSSRYQASCRRQRQGSPTH